MSHRHQKILVIGASGFVGGNLTRALRAQGYEVRCLARRPERAQALEAMGCEVVQGDVLDKGSLVRALEGIDAVYLSIHTLAAQPSREADQDFMDVERVGARHVVEACVEQGVSRLITLTLLGISADAESAWARGRWEMEQDLLRGPLDVTILRPGQIVGRGGKSFDLMMSQARKRVTAVLGDGTQRVRNIAMDDLVHYLIAVLEEPRAFNQAFDVGNDEVLTSDEMIDRVAAQLNRPRPIKLHLPVALFSTLSALIERGAKMPPGALAGVLDGLEMDMVGDPSALRALVPHQPLTYAQAVRRVLDETSTPQPNP